MKIIGHVIAALAMMVAAACAADVPAVTANTVDFSSLVHDGAMWVLTAIGGVAYYQLQRIVKDKQARDLLLAAVKNATAFGMNTVDGALKDHPLTISIASPVVAKALLYLKDHVPDALKRTGADDVKLTRLVISQLPAVSGQITDADINSIAAAASGKMPNAPANASELATALVPLLEKELTAVIGRIVEAKLKPADPAVAAEARQASTG